MPGTLLCYIHAPGMQAMTKIIKSNKKRRFCRITTCKRQLNIYNFSKYCHAHQHLAPAKQLTAAQAA